MPTRAAVVDGEDDPPLPPQPRRPPRDVTGMANDTCGSVRRASFFSLCVCNAISAIGPPPLAGLMMVLVSRRGRRIVLRHFLPAEASSAACGQRGGGRPVMCPPEESSYHRCGFPRIAGREDLEPRG